MSVKKVDVDRVDHVDVDVDDGSGRGENARIGILRKLMIIAIMMSVCGLMADYEPSLYWLHICSLSISFCFSFSLCTSSFGSYVPNNISEHDEHHRKFEVNYGFPTTHIDIIISPQTDIMIAIIISFRSIPILAFSCPVYLFRRNDIRVPIL